MIGSEMSLIFEVDSLEHASPATVSRCGMIFYDFSLVSVQDIFAYYTRKHIPELLKDYGSKLEHMFKWIVIPCLEIIKKVELNFPASEHWLVNSFISLLDSQLNYYRKLPAIKAPQKENKNNAGLSASALLSIEASFIFGVVWTFGSLMSNPKDRDAFDEFLRDRIGLEDLSDDLPSISSIRKNIVQSSNTMTSEYFNLQPDTIQRPQFALPLKRKIKVFDMLYDKERKD